MNNKKIFTDARGSIEPVVEDFKGDIIFIRCTPGAIRANHYHKTTGHWSFVTKGKLKYYERPVGSKEKPSIIELKAGEKIWTGPNLEHAMLFEEESEFICASSGCRDQNEYEADLVRLNFDLTKE